MTLKWGWLDTLHYTESQTMKHRLRLRNLLVISVALLVVTLLSSTVSAQDRFTIEDSSGWDVTLIDGSTNAVSDNSSAFSGDQIHLSIEVANDDTAAGHDEWSFHIVLDETSSPELTGFLDGSEESVMVNVSFGPLPAGEIHLVFTIDSSGESETMVLLVEPNPLNLTAAGSPEIALIGEPAHVGDTLTASILVHNQGNSPQTVQLELTPGTAEPTLGPPIIINPGSSREVSASFTPDIAGPLNIEWRVHSNNGGVARELNGTSSVEVLNSQTMTLVIDSTTWDLTNGLNSEISLYLSEGRSREVSVEVAILDQTIESIIQTFLLTLDPGRRELTLTLGHPSADSLIIRVEAFDWTASQDLEVQTILTPPLLDLEVESSGVSTAPRTGEQVILPYDLSNDGNTPTLAGEIRVVRTSDGMILDTNPTSAVGPGQSQTGQLSIASWPDSKVVEVEIIWITSGQTESRLLEIESFTDADSGAELPFDLSAAIYGAISGLVLVMFILVLYRTVSESVADTGTSRFNRLREARGERKKAAAATKREIPCPECDQRLSIPSTHAGAVKCPACTTRFSVDAVAGATPTPDAVVSSEMSQMPSPQSVPAPEPVPEQPLDDVARSMVDLLSCPSCDQTLKVPVERRPVKARCPACRSEFIAEVGQE